MSVHGIALSGALVLVLPDVGVARRVVGGGRSPRRDRQRRRVADARRADTRRGAAATPRPQPHSRRWFVVLLVSYTLEGIGYIIAGTFLVAAIGQNSRGLLGSAAWLVVGLAAAPSAALWASASARWSHPTLLVAALLLQAAGIALPALVGGVAAALVGAVLFGGTFLGVSTIALAAGRLLAFPRAVAVLTTGYSAGQILGPLMVTPLLHHGFRYALITSAIVVSASALTAGWLRIGAPTAQSPAVRCGSSTGSHTPGSSSTDRSASAVNVSTTARTAALFSPRRHTSDHVHSGAGPTHRAAHQIRGRYVVLSLRIIEHGRRSRRTWSKNVEPVTPPSSTRDHVCARVAGELFGVAVPRRPARLVGVQQHRRVARLDG